jgi:hypothetical protein
MAPKRKRPRPAHARRPVAASRGAPGPGAAAPRGFRWRVWLTRSLVVGIAVTLVTLAGSRPKHVDAGAVVSAVIIYGLIFLALSVVWELILRFWRRSGPGS